MYPLQFFKKYFRKRLASIHNNFSNLSIQNDNNKKSFFFNNKIIILFIKDLAPNFNKNSVSPIYRNSNKFNNVCLGKDKLDKLKKTNVVYKIHCQECYASYVG